MASNVSAVARKEILDRIRRAQGRGARSSPADREAIETYLGAHPRGPQPALAGDRVEQFRLRAEASQSTTAAVVSESDVPAAVRAYLERQRLPLAGSVWPALAGLDWTDAGLSLEARAATGDDAIGVTGCFAAIAETGRSFQPYLRSRPSSWTTRIPFISASPSSPVSGLRRLPAGRPTAFISDFTATGLIAE